MKKHIIIAILLVALMLLSSCIGNVPVTGENTTPNTAETKGTETAQPTAQPTTPPTPTETTPPTAPTTADPTAPLTHDDGLQIVSPQNVGMGETSYKILSVTTRGTVEVGTKLPTSMPIYEYKYFNNGDGLWYDLTDEIKAANAAKLREYLAIAYGEEVSASAEFTEKPSRIDAILAETDTGTIASAIDRISYSQRQKGIFEEYTADEILNHPMIKASLEYSGIKNPEVNLSIRYGLNGEISTRSFTIAERSDDPIQSCYNKSFACIWGGVNSFSVRGRNGELGLIPYGDYEVIPYEEVFEKLSVRYPEMKTGRVMTEIYYHYEPFFMEKTGFFIPCYRFYIETGDIASDGADLWKMIDVVMVKATMDELKAK